MTGKKRAKHTQGIVGILRAGYCRHQTFFTTTTNRSYQIFMNSTCLSFGCIILTVPFWLSHLHGVSAFLPGSTPIHWIGVSRSVASASAAAMILYTSAAASTSYLGFCHWRLVGEDGMGLDFSPGIMNHPLFATVTGRGVVPRVWVWNCP